MDPPLFASKETLEQLDWPWVLEQIQKHLHTPPARDRCDELLWLPDGQSALQCMREVDEARELLNLGHTFPLGTPPDIRPVQVRVAKEAVLQTKELLELASWMETVGAVRRHLVAQRRHAPLLHRYVTTAPSLSHLVYDIRTVVDESGEVRDEASPELNGLRKKTRRLHQEIHSKLEKKLHSPEFQDLLQDRFYTIKEDRYVLPIKTNQRSFADGIVLGSSASGATLFIEPREIVELNNTYKLVLLEAQKEILRILQELCEQIRRDTGEIKKGQNFLTQIDLIQARARFADSLKARSPTLDYEAGICLFKARHPILFLTKDRAVPNDILITSPTRTLLVTGPNAGGKTAVLKTVGLFALMARAGLPLPAAEGSNIPFFEGIFSDIGDSQSLHESRSTFSGHLLRLVDFLESKPMSSLALLDEILIGTDPEEGSALAEAVLESLSEMDGFSLATTHFLALKALAARDTRIQNASLGFHPETFEPTYEMTVGVPGASNAFFLAKQCGLPQPILDKARSRAGASETDIQELLFQIHSEKNRVEAERIRLEAMRAEAEKHEQELREKMEEAGRREKEIKRKYRERLETEFSEAMKALQAWKRQRKKSPGSPVPPLPTGKKELSELKHRLLSEGGPFYVSPPLPEAEGEIDWPTFACGDSVYVPELQTEARVVNLPDRKGNLTVEAKGFRMQVNRKQVYRPRVERKVIKGPKRMTQRPSMALLTEETPAEMSQRCDLRGLAVEDALSLTSQNLDRAVRCGLPRMVLIHGLGKGILRNAVREYLSRAPYKLTFRPGIPGEGGDGVTVVEFAG